MVNSVTGFPRYEQSFTPSLAAEQIDPLPFIPSLPATPIESPPLSSRTITLLHPMTPVSEEASNGLSSENPVPKNTDFVQWEEAFASQSLFEHAPPFSSSAALSSTSTEHPSKYITGAKGWSEWEENTLIQYIDWLCDNLEKFATVGEAFQWLARVHLQERSDLSIRSKYDQLCFNSRVAKLPQLQGEGAPSEKIDFVPALSIRLPPTERRRLGQAEVVNWSNAEMNILKQFVEWLHDDKPGHFSSLRDAFEWLKGEHLSNRSESGIRKQYKILCQRLEVKELPKLEKKRGISSAIGFVPDLPTPATRLDSHSPDLSDLQGSPIEQPEKQGRWEKEETDVLIQHIEWLHQDPDRYSSLKGAFKPLSEKHLSGRSYDSIKRKYHDLCKKGQVMPLLSRNTSSKKRKQECPSNGFFSSSGSSSSSSSIEQPEKQWRWKKEETDVLIQHIKWLHQDPEQYSSLKEAFKPLSEKHLSGKSDDSMRRKYHDLCKKGQVMPLPPGKTSSKKRKQTCPPNGCFSSLGSSSSSSSMEQPKRQWRWKKRETDILIQYVEWLRLNPDQFESLNVAFEELSEKHLDREWSVIKSKYDYLCRRGKVTPIPRYKRNKKVGVRTEYFRPV